MYILSNNNLEGLFLQLGKPLLSHGLCMIALTTRTRYAANDFII